MEAGFTEKVKRGWKALGRSGQYRNEKEIEGINFLNLVLMLCSASIILLTLVWVLFHASMPFGDTKTEMEINSSLNISYPAKRFEPNIGRTGINCTDFGSLCTPCGVSCDDMFCSNHVCSLACLDDQYLNRTGTFYTELSGENADYTTDFSRCHKTWQDHSLTLNPTSTEKKHLYTAIGGFAALLNVRFDIIIFYFLYDFSPIEREVLGTQPQRNFSVLMFGIHRTYKWSQEEGHIWIGEPKSTIDLTTRNRNLFGPIGEKRSFFTSLMSCKKLLFILSTLMVQVADSLLDALYFIKLKSKSRLIHVPPHIQAIQGLLLFACEYRSSDKVLTSHLD